LDDRPDCFPSRRILRAPGGRGPRRGALRGLWRHRVGRPRLWCPTMSALHREIPNLPEVRPAGDDHQQSTARRRHADSRSTRARGARRKSFDEVGPPTIEDRRKKWRGRHPSARTAAPLHFSCEPGETHQGNLAPAGPCRAFGRSPGSRESGATTASAEREARRRAASIDPSSAFPIRNWPWGLD
jgi:hypothetical protein